ncbi:MAG: 4Fe-4S dicluster domain-containing protein [Acidimicrobiales bacterium]
MQAEDASLSAGDRRLIDRRGVDAMIGRLRASGRRVIGPTVRDGAIVHDEVVSVADLPAGVGDEQDGGRYRLTRRADEALFGFSAPSESWKRFLFPPRALLVRSRRVADGFELDGPELSVEPLAFLGVRSCDLHAIGIQDRVFLQGTSVEPIYEARRADVFIVAVNCANPASTCFCASMGTGPKAEKGFDLALTELLDGAVHEFLVEVGTAAGAEVLSGVPHVAAVEGDQERADLVVAAATAAMGRRLDPTAPRRVSVDVDHPRWDDVAERCLACGNCTMVCPTCFCSSVEDRTDLGGEEAERWRRWESCFSLDFSYLHGGPVRSSVTSRYRQWLLHKLVTWEDQFGGSGCVGCGRCIAWCPVGIDLTAEIAAMDDRSKGGIREGDS